MSYDTKSVLDRYQQLLRLPEGEPPESEGHELERDEGERSEVPAASQCALARASGGVAYATEGCSPGGGCDSCCVGVVEMVRQFSEREISLETREVELADSYTKARKLGRE